MLFVDRLVLDRQFKDMNFAIAKFVEWNESVIGVVQVFMHVIIDLK